MKPKTPILTTERLVLKSFGEEDRAACVRILRNEEITKTYMVPDFASDEEAYPLFDKLKTLSEDQDRFVCGIYRDGALIGFLNECGREEGSVEVGYVIHPDFRGNGYAPEALRAAIGELFRIGWDEVTAGYFDGNNASRRVMEKAGMHPIAREDDADYRGQLHHCFYCAIRREEP